MVRGEETVVEGQTAVVMEVVVGQGVGTAGPVVGEGVVEVEVAEVQVAVRVGGLVVVVDLVVEPAEAAVVEVGMEAVVVEMVAETVAEMVAVRAEGLEARVVPSLEVARALAEVGVKVEAVEGAADARVLQLGAAGSGQAACVAGLHTPPARLAMSNAFLSVCVSDGSQELRKKLFLQHERLARALSRPRLRQMHKSAALQKTKVASR